MLGFPGSAGISGISWKFWAPSWNSRLVWFVRELKSQKIRRIPGIGGSWVPQKFGISGISQGSECPRNLGFWGSPRLRESQHFGISGCSWTLRKSQRLRIPKAPKIPQILLSWEEKNPRNLSSLNPWKNPRNHWTPLNWEFPTQVVGRAPKFGNFSLECSDPVVFSVIFFSWQFWSWSITTWHSNTLLRNSTSSLRWDHLGSKKSPKSQNSQFSPGGKSQIFRSEALDFYKNLNPWIFFFFNLKFFWGNSWASEIPGLGFFLGNSRNVEYQSQLTPKMLKNEEK